MSNQQVPDGYWDIEDVIDEDGKQFRAVITNDEPTTDEDPAYVVGPDGLNAIQRAEQAREQAAMGWLEGKREPEVEDYMDAMLPEDLENVNFHDEQPEWAQGIRADY